MRKIELLAPARDAEIGKAAFQHGADAVYIGAPKFSARAAASNDIKDIGNLASYGHLYGAKTFVAFNTLLKDNELEEAERMLWQIYEAGVDALIIQDLGLLKLNLPPIPLHASTQTDNRTAEKVRLMRDLGLTRVVLARELNIEQIDEIHKAVPDVELECFVHGALCVSVSGRCYLSEALTGRSANRGVCAQPCRLPMSLFNADGREVVSQKHLLSLKDMNRSTLLEELIEAGVMSLKIEGRLKDMSYVKNVTAYYRRELDRILEQHSDWQAVSDGKTYFTFEPASEKSFNRGFTSYQKNREEYWNFETPKSVGEFIGVVKSVSRREFQYEGKTLNNGDGLMVGTTGLRANKVEGFSVTPLDPSVLADIKRGMSVWRNLDYRFEKILSGKTAERKVAIDVTLEHTADGVATLSLSDGTSEVNVSRSGLPLCENLMPDDYYQMVTCKFGNTIFKERYFSFQHNPNVQLFIPKSVYNLMRQEAVEMLLQKRANRIEEQRRAFSKPDYISMVETLDIQENIMDVDAYDNCAKRQDNTMPVMITRHCLKYALGHCPKYGKPAETLFVGNDNWREPMSLKIGGKKFILKFGCKNLCNCEIFPIFAQ